MSKFVEIKQEQFVQFVVIVWMETNKTRGWLLLLGPFKYLHLGFCMVNLNWKMKEIMVTMVTHFDPLFLVNMEGSPVKIS